MVNSWLFAPCILYIILVFALRIPHHTHTLFNTHNCFLLTTTAPVCTGARRLQCPGHRPLHICICHTTLTHTQLLYAYYNCSCLHRCQKASMFRTQTSPHLHLSPHTHTRTHTHTIAFCLPQLFLFAQVPEGFKVQDTDPYTFASLTTPDKMVDDAVFAKIAPRLVCATLSVSASFLGLELCMHMYSVYFYAVRILRVCTFFHRIRICII